MSDLLSLRHDDDYFETPDWLFKEIERETQLDFDLDFCADKNNSKCVMYIDETLNALEHNFEKLNKVNIFCNPPRSKNGKFVNKIFEVWKEYNYDIVMLLCWNDLGNKYGEKIFTEIKTGRISAHNLGKVKFHKDGVESKYPSRLTYFWAWFKKQ